MRTANAMGPARSPTVLLTPSPFSANVEAHWLTDCSHAPAQTIISIRIQKILLEKSALMVSPVSFSGVRGAMGTFANTNVFKRGITAHIRAIAFQLPMPKILKYMVEHKTTPTWPQQ